MDYRLGDIISGSFPSQGDEAPGCYILWDYLDPDTALYVGQSGSPFKRQQLHFGSCASRADQRRLYKAYWKDPSLADEWRVQVIRPGYGEDLDSLERRLVELHRPHFNTLLQPDHTSGSCLPLFYHLEDG